MVCGSRIAKWGTDAGVYKRNVSAENALFSACESGDLQNIQQAVQQGAFIAAENIMGIQPIHAACGNGHLPIVQWLMQHGASIRAQDKAGFQPMHVA